MDDTLEGIPVEKVKEHAKSCAFCQRQSDARKTDKSGEPLFKMLRHIQRFFNGPKWALEPCE